MSLEKELVTATTLSAKRNEDRQTFLVRLIRATAELPDEGWSKLTTEAQKWYNDAADEMNGGKPITEFPGETAAAATMPARRVVAEVRTEAAAKPSLTLASLSVDQDVTVGTSKGDIFTGKVVEADEKTLTVMVDGNELTIRAANITSLASAITPPAASAPPPAANAGAPAKRVPPPPTVASSAPSAKAPRGKSVTQRMRELICENLSSDRETIGKMLVDEGLSFSASTLDIMFSDTRKTIECLQSLGKVSAK